MSWSDDADEARFGVRIGSVLKGKWTLEQLLGVGGMAAVYAATHRNGKRVAVKMLHPEFSSNPAVRQRFLREGYLANSVTHAGVVTVDDDDLSEDGCAFLVMELLEGETFDARWRRKGQRIEPAEVLSLFDQVLDTLAAAHERGIVHRDLKPENLFLTMGGTVKVLDFGIARVRELGSQGSPTRTGSLLGTPTFMPPEQARGAWTEVDQRSDLWAVGATMFTLLTGRFVHPAATVNEALIRSATERAPSLATVDQTFAPALVTLIDRALAFEIADRWPNATAMQDALRGAYTAMMHKPITLGDSIERDIPTRSPVDVLSLGAGGVTVMGGALATGARRSALNSLAPGRARAVLAAIGVVGAVGAGAWTISHTGTVAEPEAPIAAVPSAVTVGSPRDQAAVSFDAGAEVPAVPVVPVDHLPLARARPDAAGVARPKLPSTKQAAASGSPATPASTATNAPGSPVSADPFAARR